MADPYKDLSELQHAWLQAWANSVQHALECWQHVFDLQQNFVRNAQEQHRNHIEIACGPSFLDKYGKRAHDIDPERDV
jgi:hypothetical protein